MIAGFYQIPNDITTFGMDFAIANRFGINAVKDTRKRAVKEWKNDYKMYAWLIGNLQMMSFVSAEHGEDELGEYYSDAYYEEKYNYFEKYSENKDAIEYWYDNID